MKRKGFTLVEVLAVIVILGVVVLIAMPNVIESLTQAKRENFGNSINSLQSTAKSQFNLDKGRGRLKYKTVDGARYAIYCNKITAEENEDCADQPSLGSQNTDNVKYKIMVSTTGEIAYMYVTDGRFTYSCTDEGSCSVFDANLIFDGASGQAAGMGNAYFSVDGKKYYFEEGMTWEEFLNSGYNTEGWETADYYSEHHYTPTGGTENISYSYYPGNKKGISIREESLNCGSIGGNMWKKNYISIVSSSGFETIDKTIQKGYNYGLDYGNMC